MPTENSSVPVISDIVLIGPMRAGKTTVAKCLVEKLGVQGASMDVTGRKDYKQAGFSSAKRLILRCVKGQLCAYQYFQQFLLPALERYLPENRNCVIDLGAGHTVYWNDPDLERARKLLAPYSNVVLILPSPDLDESATILRERTRDIAWLNRIRRQNGFDMNERFLRHRSNFDLAKFTVYTENKTPRQTADEILELLKMHATTA